MTKKLTYEELEQRVEELEKELHQKKELQKERALTPNALNAQIDTFLIFDPSDGKPLRWNRMFNEVSGYSDEEIRLMSTNDFYKKEDLQRVKKTIQEVLENGRTIVDLSLVTKEGECIPYEYSSVLIKAHKGNPAICVIGRNITERKLTEKKLHESEARYQDLYDNAPDMFVSVSAKTSEIIECNQTFVQAIGYTKDEIIGRPIFDMYHPDSLEEAKKAFESFVTKGEVHNAELQLKRKDGTKIEVSLNVSAVYDEQGNILHSRSVWRDITARKRAEEALNKEKEFTEHALDALNDTFFVFNPVNGKPLRWNRIFNEVSGYSDEEIRSMTPNDFYKKEDLPWIKKATKEVLKKGRTIVELALVTKEGKSIPYEYSAVLIKAPKGNHAICTIGRDITDRKEAENKLLKQQYFLAKAQEMGKIGTWELDIRKNVLHWTDELYQIFGLPLGTELTYETFLDCVHPDDKAYVDREWKAAFNRKPYDIEHRLLMSDGIIKWVREKAELEFDEQGNCLRGTGFTQDITERKKVEETLRLINESIASEVGEDFLRNLAKQLAMSLGARYSFVGELVSPEVDRIRTIAIWANGDYADNFEYDLAGTPCEDVIKQEFCAYSEGVQQYFPDDHLLTEMGVESYVGIKLTNSSGNMVGILVSLHDKPLKDILFIKPILTTFALRAAAEIERKQAEEEIKAKQKEIEEINANLEKIVQEEIGKSRQKDFIMIQRSRLAAMGEMMQYIVHQWGQPLNALNILFYNLEIVLNEIDIGTKEKEVEGTIANGLRLVKEMFKTVDDFRNFFKPHKEKVEFVVNKNIKDILSLFGDSFTYSKISVELNETEELKVKGFPNEFSQVMLNILKNAKDAILAKGVKGKINIDILSEAAAAIIRIKDNGGGISNNILDKVFDSYFTTKAEKDGSGIGLYMSKIIIEEHMGGRINAKNVTGGAEIEIALPKFH